MTSPEELFNDLRPILDYLDRERQRVVTGLFSQAEKQARLDEINRVDEEIDRILEKHASR